MDQDLPRSYSRVLINLPNQVPELMQFFLGDVERNIVCPGKDLRQNGYRLDLNLIRQVLRVEAAHQDNRGFLFEGRSDQPFQASGRVIQGN